MPGDDFRRLIEQGLEHRSYLGHLPGLVIGNFYFYLTPLILSLGVWKLSHNLLGVAVALFGSWGVINHLLSGSNLPLINYLFFLPLLLTTNNQIVRCGIGCTMVMFHTSSAFFTLIPLLGYDLFYKKSSAVPLTIPLILGLLWHSSYESSVGVALTVSNWTKESHELVYKQGPNVLLRNIPIFLMLVIAMVTNKVNINKIYPILTTGIVGTLMSILPYRINADRTANLAIITSGLAVAVLINDKNWKWILGVGLFTIIPTLAYWTVLPSIQNGVDSCIVGSKWCY